MLPFIQIQLMTEQLSILERSLESQRLHSMELSDQLKGVNSNEGDPSKMKECLQPVVSNSKCRFPEHIMYVRMY